MQFLLYRLLLHGFDEPKLYEKQKNEAIKASLVFICSELL
jgi:hypothetical protein